MITTTITFQLPLRSCLSPAQGAENHAKAAEQDSFGHDTMSPSLASFLTSLQLGHLKDVLEREQITLEILAEMGHEDMKQVCATYELKKRIRRKRLKSFKIYFNLGWNCSLWLST